jgi:hypothetical protein
MKEAKSLDGVISYLTKKNSGFFRTINVYEKGIVILTSSSLDGDPQHALKNVVDLTVESCFISVNAPGEWVCWDFREMRVRVTHYTLWAARAQSWIVEGSLDGDKWTEIDWRKNNQDFRAYYNTASFTAARPAEYRFIRLTQIGPRHDGTNYLALYAVEFFGTLVE